MLSAAHLENHYSKNDALNAICPSFNIFSSYTNTMFLPEIGLTDIGIVIPSKYLTTSASLSFYGYSEYWNLGASVGFSHYFKPYISIGVNAFFSGFRFSGTNQFKATGGVDLSLVVFPTKNLSIGLLFSNISFSTIKNLSNKYRLPVIFRLGLSYKVYNNILIALEGGIELKHPFFINMNFEYKPVKQLILRCAISYQTSAAAMIGFGLRLGGFCMDFNVDYNLGTGAGCKAILGYTK